MTSAAVPASAWARTATPRLVSLERTGGFPGTAFTLTVRVDGLVREHSVNPRIGPRSFRLTTPVLRRLKQRLRAARFGTLQASYGPADPGSTADAFTDTLRYGDRRVAVSTAARGVPARLRRVLEALQEVSARP
jgi:hypothetical protein